MKIKKYKQGWRVQLFFQISLHLRDQALLEQIKNDFKVGSIHWTDGANSIQFQVQLIKDLRVIIDHFDKYP